MQRKKNILILLVLFLSIGVTIAYLQSTDTFENIFNAGTYSVVTHEEFTSPDNWAPGDTTPKTITTTNEGTIPVRVRVKLEESWTSANDGNLPLVSNNIQLAIINLDNTDDWIKDGDYYYYVGELAPGETTSSLIESVTFNPEYHGDITCTTVDNVETCESSNDGYMGGTYTLNITTETVQSDAYQEVWNLSYNPTVERTIYDISDSTEYGTYEETNKSVFLRKKMMGDTPKLEEVGFILNGNVYYLKGGGATYNKEKMRYNSDSVYYEENKSTLINAFGSENCKEEVINNDGTPHNGISCNNSEIYATSYNIGVVEVSNPHGIESWRCSIGDSIDSTSSCISSISPPK